MRLDERDELVIPEEPQRPDRSWENFVGVVVTAHEIRTGMSLGRYFVGVDIIEERRARSDAWRKGASDTFLTGQKKGQRKTDEEAERDRRSPWFEWPEEMSLKTALICVIRRGFVPVDDVADHVLGVDAKGDEPIIIDLPAAESVRPPAKEEPKALGTSEALDEILGTNGSTKEREKVPAKRGKEEYPPFTEEEQRAIEARERREAGDEGGDV
mgnify:CR=1 FL=1